MTGDPQPIPMPEGFDWYWPSHLNDEEWIAGGRYPDDDDRRPPSTYDDFRGPILARRKPPEPWTPKVGDRVWFTGWGLVEVLAIHRDQIWVDDLDGDTVVVGGVSNISPTDPEADQ